MDATGFQIGARPRRVVCWHRVEARCHTCGGKWRYFNEDEDLAAGNARGNGYVIPGYSFRSIPPNTFFRLETDLLEEEAKPPTSRYDPGPGPSDPMGRLVALHDFACHVCASSSACVWSRACVSMYVRAHV